MLVRDSIVKCLIWPSSFILRTIDKFVNMCTSDQNPYFSKQVFHKSNSLKKKWSRKSHVPTLLNTLIGSEGAGQVQNTVISLMNQNNAKLFRNVWPENDSRKNLKDR